MANEEATNSTRFQVFKLSGLQLKVVGENLDILKEYHDPLELVSTCTGKSCVVSLSRESGGKDDTSSSAAAALEITISDCAHIYRAGPTVIFLRLPHGLAILTAPSQIDASRLLSHWEAAVPSKQKQSQISVFNMRTEESSAKQYFQFYGYLSQQQNMLQDYVRTGTYQSAMLQNTVDFKDKVVLDVGAGTGILSFFALQAGARKVYAIEASNMAQHCQRLVKDNGFAGKMTVICGKVEEVEVPEKVDMIISEPMGYMLFNERMLETYLHAKKWLKPGGNMFPTKGILYVAPFTDEALYLEQFSKANFWTQSCFHGVNVSSLREEALEEYFKQPVLDTFDVRIVMAKPIGHTTDFLEANESDLIKINIPLRYKMWSTGMVHGLAFWFDCAFCGTEASVWLSTAPFQPLTHWYQIRVLLPKPLFLHKEQEVTGHLRLVANERQSYDVTVELSVPSSGIKCQSSYDLKNPNFRYMTTPLSVPGTLHSAPTENFFTEGSLATQQQPVANSLPLNSDGQTQATVPPQQTNIALSTSNSTPQHQHVPTSQSLNPAAPQFIPLPLSSSAAAASTHLHHHHHPASSAHGSTHFMSYSSVGSSAAGYHQPSTMTYMMGSEQMVYSQSLSSSPAVTSLPPPGPTGHNSGQGRYYHGIASSALSSSGSGTYLVSRGNVMPSKQFFSSQQ